MIEFKKTQRGFLFGEFKDRYGAECSIQESSLATEAAIWLGVDKDHNGQEVQFGRMHLTQDMAKELIPVLRYFAMTGQLKEDAVEELYAVGVWVVGVGETNKGVHGRVVATTFNEITVQDNSRAGVEGQYICLKPMAPVVWDPIEPPTTTFTRYDVMRDGD